MTQEEVQNVAAESAQEIMATPGAVDHRHASEKKWEDRIATGVGLLVGIIIFIAPFFAAFWEYAQTYLDVFATVQTTDSHSWTLRGHVLYKGDPVPKARVWVVLSDRQGHRDSPGAAVTDSEGKYEIKGVPTTIVPNEAVSQITVYAKSEIARSIDGKNSTKTVQGQEVFTLPGAGAGSYRRVSISFWSVAFLPTIFLLSIAVGFLCPSPIWKYRCSIGFAFLFTVAMIAVISLGLSYVNTTGKPGEILSLGFASMFHATYVKEVTPEWVFSLTSPGVSVGQDGGAVLTGFGAPLWIVLISVVGSGLLTVSMIVREIKEAPDFNKEDVIKERIEKIIRHQFFILFAPVGAIFIYQLLVAAGAAEKQLTVALATLGAGASLNILLNKAIESAEKVFRGA